MVTRSSKAPHWYRLAAGMQSALATHSTSDVARVLWEADDVDDEAPDWEEPLEELTPSLLQTRLRGVDSRRLVQAGCVAGASCERGQLLPLVGVSALVACDQRDTLGRWVSLLEPETREERPVLAALHALCVDQDEQRAREALAGCAEPQPEEHGLIPALIWLVGLGDEEQARGWLTRYEPQLAHELYPEQWCELARCYELLLGDSEEAQRCLGQGLGVAGSYSADATASIARAWIDCFDEGTRTRWLLEAVEREATLSWRFLRGSASLFRAAVAWSAAARGWKLLLDDDERCARCLREAEGYAKKDGWLLTALAVQWSVLLSSRTDTSRLLALPPVAQFFREHQAGFQRLREHVQG